MPKRNAILACLPAAAWDRIRDRCVLVDLEKGQVVMQPGEEIADIYFPTTSVMALGAETVAGESVNVVLLGREGALGVFEACGSHHSHFRATAQLAGEAWRISARAYRRLFEDSAELREAIHKYVEVLMVEERFSVACAALHTVDNRLARVLLEISDKSQARRLPITHQALSELLGVQRTTVVAAVSGLSGRGLIRSGRGWVEILDPEGLEAAACSCRATVAYARKDIHARTDGVCEA